MCYRRPGIEGVQAKPVLSWMLLQLHLSPAMWGPPTLASHGVGPNPGPWPPTHLLPEVFLDQPL